MHSSHKTEYKKIKPNHSKTVPTNSWEGHNQVRKINSGMQKSKHREIPLPGHGTVELTLNMSQTHAIQTALTLIQLSKG